MVCYFVLDAAYINYPKSLYVIDVIRVWQRRWFLVPQRSVQRTTGKQQLLDCPIDFRPD